MGMCVTIIIILEGDKPKWLLDICYFVLDIRSRD